MSYEIQFTEHAKNDIDDIIDYIKVKLCNSKAADNFLNKILESIDVLSNNPKMYSEFNNERLQYKGYRKMFIDNYIFPYRIYEKNQKIIIARVLYIKRDYEKYI